MEEVAAATELLVRSFPSIVNVNISPNQPSSGFLHATNQTGVSAVTTGVVDDVVDLDVGLGVDGDGSSSGVEPSEFDVALEFIVKGVLTTTVSVLGIMGNVISLAVLSKPQMRSSVNCCLQALAVFDTVVLVTAILMLGLPTLGAYLDVLEAYKYRVFPFIVPHVVYPLALMAQTGSVWMTVAVTVERYVAVCRPLRARSLCTYSRARICNVVVTVFAVCYNIPRFWEAERVPARNLDGTNRTVLVIAPSPFRANRLYVEIYYIWLYLFVMYFIPFLALSVLNTFIWRAVRRANRDRQQLSRRQEKEISLATMLLCVVVVFFVCNALALVVNVVEYFCDCEPVRLAILSNFLVILNSSVNFIVYCIYGQKFKQVLCRMLCRYCTQPARMMDDSLRRGTLLTTDVGGSNKNFAYSTTEVCPNDSTEV